MPKIPDNIITEISPRKFEILVKAFISELGHNLKKFQAYHDVKVKAHDGTYQIDVKATFEALGSDFIVLIECKHHKSSVKREVVEILYNRLQSSGSQKGMIFSTSKFQSGALKFAEAHGIALVRLIEGKFTYSTKSVDGPKHEPPPWANIPEYVGEFNYIENGRRTTSYLQKGYMEPLQLFIFGILKWP
jgi:restriction system protein